MCIRNSAFVALCSAVVFSTVATAADIAIYRWLDENNVVHFSQHEPQDKNYSQLTTFASYKAKQQSEADDAPLLSVDEQLSQYEKKKVEVAEKNKVIAEKNCKAAQLNIKMLNSLSKVTILAPDGKNRVLTAKEKKAQLQLSKKHVDLYCKKAGE
jgi:hypothetical protein